MNSEYIYFIINDIYALQYLTFNSSTGYILNNDDHFVYHCIYGPSTSHNGYKGWRQNNGYYRKYYPYSIALHDSTESTQYEVLDWQTGSIFVYIVKNNVIRNFTSYGRHPISYEFKIEYNGNQTYKCGLMRLKKHYSEDLFVLNEGSQEPPESKLLRRIHAEHQHLFQISN